MALTTILTVAPFIGYGRQAVAACSPAPLPPAFSCSGASAGEFFNGNNIHVTTVTGFSVNSVFGNGITITGDGLLTFIDDNASSITSRSGNGLEVRSTDNVEGGASGGVMIRTNGRIMGSRYGIYAVNEGAGDLSITADGAVTGKGYDGIYALNEGNDLTIITGAGSVIKGKGDDGIDARNDGEGKLTVTVNGDVTGEDVGLYARNEGTDLSITTGAQSEIVGDDAGIVALNRGAGDLDITVYGRVEGRGNDGIVADNGFNDGEMNLGVNLTVRTGAQSRVDGESDGILASNFGRGQLEIIADGKVYGEDSNGIEADNSDYGTDLIITTGAQSVIEGGDNGIDAENDGEGALDIKVYGQVVGEREDGIDADNYGTDLIITTGAQSVIQGGDNGIYAENNGDGELAIKVYGRVFGERENGIYADNDGTDLTITTGVGSRVEGRDNGIYAEQDGDGDLTITVDGRVTGGNYYGIYARNEGWGWDPETEEPVETRITIGTSGLVEGYESAIKASSENGQEISITNYGVVRNLSGNSADIAIETYGGRAEIENNGDLIGTVRLGDGEFLEDNNDRLDNAGLWNTTGRSTFGGGYDEVVNSGLLLAANDVTENEETLIFDLEAFKNDGGLISMVDGAAGDTLALIGEFEGMDALTYYASNGRLAVDAVLAGGAAGEADILEIDGNVDEAATTIISVNIVDVVGANTLGIPVVKVLNGGEAHAGNFGLDRPVQAGLFSWDLRYNVDDNWYELFTAGVGVGAYEFAAGLTGAQDIWQQTTGTLAQRQADLRPVLNGTQVTPVADFKEPVAPTAAGRVGPGFWFNAVGGYLDRDAEQDGFSLDRKQSIYGGLAGFDVATGSAGDTWLFGIFGGYLSSTLKFSDTNTEWTYDGPTVGAYATYLNDAFYADATVKADFLSISIDPDDLAPAADDSDTDGVNLGGRIDAGYKIGAGQGLFVEPQATLAVVNTTIDDTEAFGGDVDFDSETSVKGRLGLRLGYDTTASNAVIYSSDLTASVWQEFNGSNDASIATAGLDDFGVSDDTIGTLGDISLGFGVTAPEGWSGFLRGSYQFADDYAAIAGNAGLRYAW